MYNKFKYESLPLAKISLDTKNPRIVTQSPLKSQAKIIRYLFEHEGLADFIKKIVSEGKNPGAERPYVVKIKSKYTVVEGNTRIAAYKLLTGLETPPTEYESAVPTITDDFKESLKEVDCSIAPNRDSLLSIMAGAHFGLGDKSRWGYLGSRKAVYNEWKDGKTIPALSKAFKKPQGEIRNLIIEYELYLHSLKYAWSKAEKQVLLNPSVEFNPPIRFLQTSGHKEKIGIKYDKTNLKIVFDDTESKNKFRHLISKLVVFPEKGLGATASYEKVFDDYKPTKNKPNTGSTGTGSTGGSSTGGTGGGGTGGSGTGGTPKKPNALFQYDVSINNALMKQLMKEAKNINTKNFPSSGTFLLRSIVEALLKHIIDTQNLNPQNKDLQLADAISLCVNKAKLSKSDKKVLKEFNKDHLNYLNLGSHGNIIPNQNRLFAARDSIDQFVKKHV